MENTKQDIIKQARIAARETGLPFVQALKEVVEAALAFEEMLRTQESFQDYILRLRRLRQQAFQNAHRSLA